MDNINILVTGIGGGSHGEQVVKSIRLIDDLDITLIGTDVTNKTTGKRLVDFFYKVPYASDPSYSDKLFDIIEKHKVHFVFHGSEPELKFISENRELFEQKKIKHPLNSQEVIQLCMDKHKTFKALGDLGINVGRYKKIDSSEDIRNIDFFPLVLKPSTGSGGSANVHICFDREDLELTANYMLKYGVDLIAQEYVHSDEEYTIGVSSDSNGNILGAIAIKRVLGNSLSTRIKIKRDDKLYMISTGISQGEIVNNETLLIQAKKIASGLRSVGPLNIQCRVVEEQLVPFEINPRLSGTTSLRAMAGYNEPKSMILTQLLGRKQTLDQYEYGTILRTIEEVPVD